MQTNGFSKNWKYLYLWMMKVGLYLQYLNFLRKQKNSGLLILIKLKRAFNQKENLRKSQTLQVKMLNKLQGYLVLFTSFISVLKEKYKLILWNNQLILPNGVCFYLINIIFYFMIRKIICITLSDWWFFISSYLLKTF